MTETVAAARNALRGVIGNTRIFGWVGVLGGRSGVPPRYPRADVKRDHGFPVSRGRLSEN